MSCSSPMEERVFHARKEAEEIGFVSLYTPEEVDTYFNKPGTTFVLVNSICGCAGGNARPAADAALCTDYRPDHLVTVFAGQQKEATARAREYFEGYPPSSPSFALMKDGKCVGMVGRDEIEGNFPVDIAEKIQSLFEQHCTRL